MGSSLCNDADAHNLLVDVIFKLFSLMTWLICMIIDLLTGQRTDT